MENRVGREGSLLNNHLNRNRYVPLCWTAQLRSLSLSLAPHRERRSEYSKAKKLVPHYVGIGLVVEVRLVKQQLAQLRRRG